MSEREPPGSSSSGTGNRSRGRGRGDAPLHDRPGVLPGHNPFYRRTRAGLFAANAAVEGGLLERPSPSAPSTSLYHINRDMDQISFDPNQSVSKYFEDGADIKAIRARNYALLKKMNPELCDFYQKAVAQGHTRKGKLFSPRTKRNIERVDRISLQCVVFHSSDVRFR